MFKRGKRSPVWVGRFREDFLGPDGTRIRRLRSVVLGRCCEMGKRPAQRLLSKRLAGINQGLLKPELNIGFSRFVLERWEPSVLPTLRFSTARNYRNQIRHHLLPRFGEMPLADIGTADVQAFVAELAPHRAPKTVLALKNLLSKIFSVAVDWGMLRENAARRVQTPTLELVRERRALTAEQARALLAELAEPYRTMVLSALLSGLRRGEIFALRWKNVDWERGSVRVLEASYEGHAGPPKTRAARREVFLAPVALDALRLLRPVPPRPEGLVFPSQAGTALDPNHVMNRVIRPACRRAGLWPVGWHQFRYTFATWADASGESLKALQAQMGHTDPRLTLGVYTQPMPEQQRRISGKVAGKLFPIVPKFASEPESEEAVIQ